MSFLSPLRYPGGKACLAGLLEAVIDMNDIRGGDYFEPFAGGAGAALSLLQNDAVGSIHLNDLDPRIYAFWKAALNQTPRFIDRIMDVRLTIEEWRKQRNICEHPRRFNQLDVGFAAFFLNRCNRSGVLVGAGPIGGFAQTGKWRLDARFNRAELSARVAFIGRNKGSITISKLNGVDFLKRNLPRGLRRQKTLVYLDPPYVMKGKRLYLNAFQESDHADLAKYINCQKTVPWIMSYDVSDLIKKLYVEQNVSTFSLVYSLQDKRSATELMIAPDHVMTPSTCKIKGVDRQLVRVA